MISYYCQPQLIVAFMVIIFKLILPITSLNNLSTPTYSVPDDWSIDVMLDKTNSSVPSYTFSTYLGYATKLIDKREVLTSFIELKADEYIRIMFVIGMSLINTQKSFAHNPDDRMSRYMFAIYPHAIVFTQSDQNADKDFIVTRLSLNPSTAAINEYQVTDKVVRVSTLPNLNDMTRKSSMRATPSDVQAQTRAIYHRSASKVHSSANYVWDKHLDDRGALLHDAHHILRPACPDTLDSNRGQSHVTPHTWAQTASPVLSAHTVYGIGGIGQAFSTKDNTTTQPTICLTLESTPDRAKMVISNTDDTMPCDEGLTTVSSSDTEDNISYESTLTHPMTAEAHHDEAKSNPLIVSNINDINTVTPKRQMSTQAVTIDQRTDTINIQALTNALPDQCLSQTHECLPTAAALQTPVSQHALRVVEQEVGYGLVAATMTATTKACFHDINDSLEIGQPCCDILDARLQTEAQAHNMAIDAKAANLLKPPELEITPDHLGSACMVSKLHPDAADQLDQHFEDNGPLSVINPITIHRLPPMQCNSLADDRHQSHDVRQAINRARSLIPGEGNTAQVEAMHALLHNVSINAAVQAGQGLSCDEINIVIAFPMSLKTRIIDSIAAIRTFNHNQAATTEQIMDYYTLVTHIKGIVPTCDEYQAYSRAQPYDKANILEVISTTHKLNKTHHPALFDELIACP